MTSLDVPREKRTWRQRSDVVIAPGEALSVMCPSIYAALDPVIKPVRGWRDVIPRWYGINCKIGRVEMQLPLQATEGSAYNSFSLLLLLPEREPLGVLPYVYLGAQFFLENRGRLNIDFASAPASGTLLTP